MQIKQWEDENLSQFSYAVLSDCEKKIILVDPRRDPQQYLDYARETSARIVGVIETHPHADFVSSHLELSLTTGAPIYTSTLVDAGYEYLAFDEGDTLEIGKIQLIALHTPGHSPDSISVLLKHDGKQKAVFSGDSLFIGDCGRPDLREAAGKLRGKRLELAKSMYHTLRDKFIPLDDDVILYPAHGAGTLCGKGLSKANSSTMAEQKQTNWSLQSMTEDEFVEALLSDQPFVPAYFPFDVELNRNGAPPFRESIAKVNGSRVIGNGSETGGLDESVMIVDVRDEKDYKKGHLANSVNIMVNGKFETWLGSIIKPEETFYLVGGSVEQLQASIERAASIGYETFIKEAIVLQQAPIEMPMLDVEAFKRNQEAYTIIDVRNSSEVKENRPFLHSVSIPLPELRDRISEIPTHQPIVVHCAGGYRSAAGSSMVATALQNKVKVFDLGEDIKQF